MKSTYIHIPFCEKICTYCDFCKIYYKKKWIKTYLEALKKEISETYNGESIKTIYIGGGTPTSLELEELDELCEILKLIDQSCVQEITVECNVENITTEKLKILKKNNVTRLSIGVQTFNEKYLSFLGRNHRKEDVKRVVAEAREIGFDNINIDLMYGFYGQTLDELKVDIEEFMKLDVEHLSVYSLIIEENTALYIKDVPEIDEDINAKMYHYIKKYLTQYNYHHYEISNYAKDGYESKHNLVYWNNEEYYGFGLGASSFIGDRRYENTKSLSKYLKGDYVSSTKKLNKKEQMENEIILGLRKLTGVDNEKFKKKYGKEISEVFELDKLLKGKQLIKKNNQYLIPEEYLFISNEILINFID